MAGDPPNSTEVAPAAASTADGPPGGDAACPSPDTGEASNVASASHGAGSGPKVPAPDTTPSADAPSPPPSSSPGAAPKATPSATDVAVAPEDSLEASVSAAALAIEVASAPAAAAAAATRRLRRALAGPKAADGARGTRGGAARRAATAVAGLARAQAGATSAAKKKKKAALASGKGASGAATPPAPAPAPPRVVERTGAADPRLAEIPLGEEDPAFVELVRSVLGPPAYAPRPSFPRLPLSPCPFRPSLPRPLNASSSRSFVAQPRHPRPSRGPRRRCATTCLSVSVLARSFSLPLAGRVIGYQAASLPPFLPRPPPCRSWRPSTTWLNCSSRVSPPWKRSTGTRIPFPRALSMTSCYGGQGRPKPSS